MTAFNATTLQGTCDENHMAEGVREHPEWLTSVDMEE